MKTLALRNWCSSYLYDSSDVDENISSSEGYFIGEKCCHMGFKVSSVFTPVEARAGVLCMNQ